MQCRERCGACCIAASITRPLPGMPEGKPAGVPCVNLDMPTRRCGVWGSPDYPDLCRDFTPAADVCGDSAEEALLLIRTLELETR